MRDEGSVFIFFKSATSKGANAGEEVGVDPGGVLEICHPVPACVPGTSAPEDWRGQTQCPLPVGDVPYGVCRGLATPLSHPSGCERVGAKARGGHHGPAADPLLEPHRQSKTWELGGCFGV